MQTLRLERLSPSVLVALLPGNPELVWCEEPHHGVQFGVEATGGAVLFIPVRDASGHLVIRRQDNHADLPFADTQIPLPMRVGGKRVVAVAQLRQDIITKQAASAGEVSRRSAAAATGADWRAALRSRC